MTLAPAASAQVLPDLPEFPDLCVPVPPGADLPTLVDASLPGQSFCLDAGLHRVSRTIRPKADQSFIGAPGAVLSGAISVVGFTSTSGAFSAPAPIVEPVMRGECRDATSGLCRIPNTVFVDDVPMVPAPSLDELDAGESFLDYDTAALYLAEEPAGSEVEVASTPFAFYGINLGTGTPGVSISGLVIEKFANLAQSGAISTYTGTDWRIEDNEIRLNHGCGIWSGSGAVVSGNYVHHNGQLGLCGQGDSILVENNEISFNNNKGFDPRWEAGGSKWVNTTDLIVRGNHSHNNYGPGLWTDINNLDVLYDGNLIEFNENEGILHEISYRAVIRGNTIRRNGLTASKGVAGSGITISTSRDVTVTGNRIAKNRNGILLRSDDRGTGTHGLYLLENVRVAANRIRMTRGFTGVLGSAAGSSVYSGVTFENNTYRVGKKKKAFRWRDRMLTLRGWRSQGNDRP